jgi:two-component system response regulator AtoC
MRALVAELRRFARSEANVLITGETGAGKDAVARALHLLGGRSSEPFVTVDCPGLPASLLEAELFGYERGAFTDASIARPGRFELAGSGTIYLDRVHELPPELQAKLLRLVEHKQVERLGTAVAVPVRARIVASAADLIEAAVESGSFRTDLYHRLRVLPLRVPPLRERRADLRPLIRHFLRVAARRAGRPTPTLTAEATARLMSHTWPGNVRELEHTLDRAVLGAADAVIDADELRLEATSVDTLLAAAPGQPRLTLELLERRYIELVLLETRGSQTRAARILGISRKALWEKRKRFGLS